MIFEILDRKAALKVRGWGIMRLLDRINRQGTTVVMATHDDEFVDQMRKRVIELKAGQVVRDQDRGVYGSDR